VPPEIQQILEQAAESPAPEATPAEEEELPPALQEPQEGAQ
jgi:hypothetical protein